MEITSFEKCTGCSLCVASCPVGAIEQHYEECGAFWHPKINETRCIKCNKCVSVCPANYALQMPECEKYCAVAQSTDIALLRSATSGGAASALVKTFVEAGGVVYGAAFDSEMRVRHIRCTTTQECERIKGSKYIQSNIDDVYAQIKEDLKSSLRVLFIGTPCQCAAVKKMFDRNDAFFCCDFVCNGVGSPSIFRQHRRFLEKTYRCKISDYVFRPKKHGYLEPYERFRDVNGKEYSIKSPWKKWGSLYYSALVIRKCCYHCAYACQDHKVADITLSDIPMSLSSLASLPHNVKQYGGSLLSINTNKGEQMIQTCASLYTSRVEVSMRDGDHHATHDIAERNRFLMLAQQSFGKAKRQYLGCLCKCKGTIIEILDYIKRKYKK